MRLDEASAIKVGSTDALAVYVGTEQVWPAGGRSGVVSYVTAGTWKRTATAGTAHEIQKPAGTANGNLLVAGLSVRGDNTTITAPSGWTMVGQQFRAGDTSANGCKLAVAYRIQQSGDPSSWTWTTAATRFTGSGVIALTGHDPTAPVGDATFAEANSSTVIYPGLTVDYADSMLVGLASAVATSVAPPPSGPTERWDLGTGSGGLAAGAGWTVPANDGASGTFNGSISGGTYWASCLLEIIPAP